MKRTSVFISWSGSTSREIAATLRDWLPSVMQHVDPWCSQQDISTGSTWNRDLRVSLQECDFGVVVVTPENVRAPWLNFEAGAIAKNLDVSRIAPLLVGISPSEVVGPLSQFQMFSCTEEDLWSLVESVNAASDVELRLDVAVLGQTFKALVGRMLDDYEAVVSKAGGADTTEAVSKRTDRNILDEMLDLVRALVRQRESAPQSSQPAGESRAHFAGREMLFPVGAEVTHKKWGSGVVIDRRGSGDKAEATIRFSTVGQKTLLLAWAPLEVDAVPEEPISEEWSELFTDVAGDDDESNS